MRYIIDEKLYRATSQSPCSIASLSDPAPGCVIPYTRDRPGEAGGTQDAQIMIGS